VDSSSALFNEVRDGERYLLAEWVLILLRLLGTACASRLTLASVGVSHSASYLSAAAAGGDFVLSGAGEVATSTGRRQSLLSLSQPVAGITFCVRQGAGESERGWDLAGPVLSPLGQCQQSGPCRPFSSGQHSTHLFKSIPLSRGSTRCLTI